LLLNNIGPILFLDALALVSGVLAVWLTVRKNIACWPLGIVSVSLQGFRFFQNKLYADALLQLLFVCLGAYGWMRWYKGTTQTPLHNFFKHRTRALALAGMLWPLLYSLLICFNGARPIMDSGLTAFSIVATLFAVQKNAFNWLLWTGIDAVYVVLFLKQALWPYAALYGFYTILALWGFYTWTRQKTV